MDIHKYIGTYIRKSTKVQVHRSGPYNCHGHPQVERCMDVGVWPTINMCIHKYIGTCVHNGTKV